MVTSTPVISRGHLPAQSVDVRANELARARYLGLVADTRFPDGAVIAELSHDGTGESYVMRKDSGVWSYFELDPRGTLVTGGAHTWCVECHAQAPSEQLFGLPRTP